MEKDVKVCLEPLILLQSNSKYELNEILADTPKTKAQNKYVG